MKEFASCVAVLALALVVCVAVPGARAEEAKLVHLTGYITDEWCGAKNANPGGADCARDCAKKGSELAIFSDGKLYRLSDKERSLEFLGSKVIVTGTLDAEDKKVNVRSIEKAKDQA